MCSVTGQDFQENFNALQWSIDEISRRWKLGDRLDFVVFTGDLGLEGLRDGAVSPGPSGEEGLEADGDPECKAQNPAAAGARLAKAHMSFAAGEKLLACLLSTLPEGLQVYFVPGNNDLTREDPSTLPRYQKFLAGLSGFARGNRVVDLNERTDSKRGYTLVGLDSAGFKPQKYKEKDEASLVRAGTVPSSGGRTYCDELNEDAGPRAVAKYKAMQTFARLVAGSGPYLVFTHEPDIRDPWPARDKNEDDSHPEYGYVACDYRSTWLLTKKARCIWQETGLNNPHIRGIFAGHFHSEEMDKYGGPHTNQAVKATNPPTTAKGFAPIYITPPLAVKYQLGEHPTTRGMSFFTVNQADIKQEMEILPTVGSKMLTEATTRSWAGDPTSQVRNVGPRTCGVAN